MKQQVLHEYAEASRIQTRCFYEGLNPPAETDRDRWDRVECDAEILYYGWRTTNMAWQRAMMENISIKEEARRLVDQLPDNSTWDDLMHEIYVRQAIERGLADSQAGRTTSIEAVREKFGLNN